MMSHLIHKLSRTHGGLNAMLALSQWGLQVFKSLLADGQAPQRL